MKAAIFTGSRHWLNRSIVKKAFDQLQPDIVIEGGADGLDTMAKWEALERGITVVTMKADWKSHGRSAGPQRNNKMLAYLLELEAEGCEISVQAFPKNGGRGTQNMIGTARAVGVPVKIHKCDKTADPMGRGRNSKYARKPKNEVADR